MQSLVGKTVCDADSYDDVGVVVGELPRKWELDGALQVRVLEHDGVVRTWWASDLVDAERFLHWRMARVCQRIAEHEAVRA